MSDTKHDLPAIEERPLVTFALFAYNQEKYIREAVEGAFSQTYEPLEIILSDDCSSDRTFQIMQEMAEAYRGPHRVMVRRNEINLRPYAHVLRVAGITKGEIMVLAAGDDVSKPNRTETIYEASRVSDAWAFQSRFDLIDESGIVLNRSQRLEILFSEDSEFNRYFYNEDGHVSVVHGATSAYRREFINIAPSNDSGILSEDGVFTLLLNMKRKRAHFVEKSLVNYRTHSEATSNTRFKLAEVDLSICREIIAREELYAKNISDRSILALDFQANTSENLRPLNSSYMREEIVIQQAKYNWQHLNLLQRLQAFKAAVNRRKIGYLVPSILGPRLGPLYIYIRNRLTR